jgi:AAA domain
MSERTTEPDPDDPSTWIPKSPDGKQQTNNGTNGAQQRYAGRLRILSVDDLMDLPERDYLVKGLLSPAEISLLVGAKNARKTFLALHICYGVAHRWPTIFGRRVKQTPILYLIAEGEAGIGKRVKALVGRYGRCADFHVIAQPIDLLRSNASAGDLHDVIEAANMHQVGLIVVDTVSRAMMGGDENAPTDMGTLAGNLNILRHETGAHVMGVHHGTQADGTKSRGHSALPFSVDVIIQTEWSEENGTGSVIVGFCRDDAIGPLGTFRTEVVQLGTDADGDLITTLVVEETDQPTGNRRATVGRMNDRHATLWDHVKAMMAQSGMPVVPTMGMPEVTGMPRPSLRNGLIQRGWFHEGQLLDGEKVAKAGFTEENNALTALKRRNLVEFNRTYVWLP